MFSDRFFKRCMMNLGNHLIHGGRAFLDLFPCIFKKRGGPIFSGHGPKVILG